MTQPPYQRMLERIHHGILEQIHQHGMLERNLHDWALFLFLFIFPATWLASVLAPQAFAAVERFGTRLAEQKRLCIILLAITPIVLRIALLSTTPIPFPRAHDEFSYLVAADTFSHGRLTNPPHAMQFYLDTFHINQQPTYMSMYPPAQGVVLAVGETLGNPWYGILIAIAIMSGAILWALQGWLPPRWALLGGILAVFHLAISTYWINSYWGGEVAATGGALVFGALPRIMRSARTGDALILGLGTIILTNSRPFEGFMFCVPVFVTLVVWLVRRQGRSLQTAFSHVVFPFSAVALASLCFVGYYNFRLTGHPTLFPEDLNVRTHYAIPLFALKKAVAPLHFSNPQFEAFYNHWWPANSWLGGRPDSFIHIAHALELYVLKSARFYLYPELFIVAVALPRILRDRRMRFPVAQVLFCFAGFLLAACFMPHYAAPLTATIFLLIVQGLRHLRQWKPNKYFSGINLSRAVFVSTLLLSPIPNKNVNSPHSVLEYRQRITAQLRDMPGDDLIIVHYSADHDPNIEWVYNASDVDHAKIVWAREIPGVSLQPLLRYFHDRHVWVLNADGTPPVLSSYTPPTDESALPPPRMPGHP